MPEAAITFRCACCGEEISGPPDLSFDAPVYYHNIPDHERDARAKLDADFCTIDGTERFIRAVCPVPIIGTDEHFGWGVWVSLSEDSFAKYSASFGNADQSKIDGMFGWLSNRLPGYTDTLSLGTSVIPQDDNQRPLVWVNTDHADHPLFIDQRDGIDMTRLGILYAAHHAQLKGRS